MWRLAQVVEQIDPENSVARLAAVRNWFARGFLHYTPDPAEGVEADLAPTKPGSAARLSRHRAIQVAITVQLADVGLPPKDAADFAVAFSDVSIPPRLPGGLFTTGDTILCVWRGPRGSLERAVVNPTRNSDLRHVRFLAGGAHALRQAMITVDCAEILRSLEPLFEES